MRVLHFAKYAFERPGGIERHVEVLTRGLAAAGAEVWVLAYDPTGQAQPRTVADVRVEPVSTFGHVGSQAIAPGMLARVRSLASEGRFDIVHQHWPDPFAHVIASLAPASPVHVASWHTDIVRQRLLGPLYLKFASGLLRKPDAIIGATAAHLRASQIDRFAPPERRHVIPYGIDTTPLLSTAAVMQRAQALRQEFGQRPLVFALGRHVYYKGFDVLIEAMGQVPALLVLGGEGPLTNDLRELATRHRVLVHFTGPIAEADLPAYFHACDVFCLPSSAPTEAFGLVQAEAMACGKPVVNTWLHNGVNEVAPHGICALTVEPGDANALAAALNHLMAHPAEANNLGQAGKDRVNSTFTVEAMVRQTWDLYATLLHKATNSSAALPG
ncbi:MAG: glycosyltransferase [Betaproteobacteria bacterium]|nr:glycosyltransferase [Betaproteobacteria bacterium]